MTTSGGFAPFVDLEQRSDGVRLYDMRIVPGLLQIEPYARAVNAVPGRPLPPAELDRLIQIRMRRQEILHGERPTTLHAIIDEAVLCRRIGDANVMRDQLLALTTPRPDVVIQVLSFSAGTHDSLVGPLTIMQLPDEPDVAYTDSWATGQVIDTPAEVYRAQKAFEQLAALALPPDMSVEMIQAYVEEL